MDDTPPLRPIFCAHPTDAYMAYESGAVVRAIAMLTYFASDPLTVQVDCWDVFKAERVSTTLLRTNVLATIPDDENGERQHGSAQINRCGQTRDGQYFDLLIPGCTLRDFLNDTTAVCPPGSFEERARIHNQISEIEQYLGGLQ